MQRRHWPKKKSRYDQSKYFSLQMNSSLKMPASNNMKTIRTALLLMVFVLLFGVYGHIYLAFLPIEGGFGGHDWSYLMPVMLNGTYWMIGNGLLEIPWFTPAKCGGYSYYANEGFYSLPTLLAYWTGPLRAVQITFLLFAGLGFLGFYTLLRQVFKSGILAATLGATLFLFNGFYGHRAIVGHFTFHAFMLVPVLALLLLKSDRNWQQRILKVFLVGSGFAYMVHTPMLQILPATILAITPILTLHAMRYDWSIKPWIDLALGGLFGLALSASKLIAMSSLMAQFPRTYYPLPGIAKFSTLIATVFQVLFGEVPEGVAQLMSNATFEIGRHEWEFGVSPVALILILAGIVFATKKIISDPLSQTKITKGYLIGSVLLMINLLLPILLNWYEPHWNALLKKLPYFGTSSNLVRWLIIEIPILCVLSVFSYEIVAQETIKNPLGRVLLATTAIIAILYFNLQIDRGYYRQNYDFKTLASAWGIAKAYNIPQKVSWVIAQNNVLGNGPNDALAAGASSILCYEPTMGYGLEKFPVGSLHPGPVFSEDSQINFKNPACYLYPSENHCKAGDHFSPSEQEATAALTNYKPYPFLFSTEQIIANRISLAAFFALLIGIGLQMLFRVKKHFGRCR